MGIKGGDPGNEVNLLTVQDNLEYVYLWKVVCIQCPKIYTTENG